MSNDATKKKGKRVNSMLEIHDSTDTKSSHSIEFNDEPIKAHKTTISPVARSKYSVNNDDWLSEWDPT